MSKQKVMFGYVWTCSDKYEHVWTCFDMFGHVLTLLHPFQRSPTLSSDELQKLTQWPTEKNKNCGSKIGQNVTTEVPTRRGAWWVRSSSAPASWGAA